MRPMDTRNHPGEVARQGRRDRGRGWTGRGWGSCDALGSPRVGRRPSCACRGTLRIPPILGPDIPAGSQLPRPGGARGLYSCPRGYKTKAKSSAVSRAWSRSVNVRVFPFPHVTDALPPLSVMSRSPKETEPSSIRTMSVPSSKSTIVSPTTPSAGLKTKTSPPAPPVSSSLPAPPPIRSSSAPP